MNTPRPITRRAKSRLSSNWLECPMMMFDGCTPSASTMSMTSNFADDAGADPGAVHADRDVPDDLVGEIVDAARVHVRGMEVLLVPARTHDHVQSGPLGQFRERGRVPPQADRGDLDHRAAARVLEIQDGGTHLVHVGELGVVLVGRAHPDAAEVREGQRLERLREVGVRMPLFRRQERWSSGSMSGPGGFGRFRRCRRWPGASGPCRVRCPGRRRPRCRIRAGIAARSRRGWRSRTRSP